MDAIEIISKLWPMVSALIIGAFLFVIWLVRLEGRVDEVKRANGETQKDVDALRIRHESLDSNIFEQLSEMKQSLARLEGALGVGLKRDG